MCLRIQIYRMRREILDRFELHVEAVAEWLGTSSGLDSPGDMSCRLFAGRDSLDKYIICYGTVLQASEGLKSCLGGSSG